MRITRHLIRIRLVALLALLIGLGLMPVGCYSHVVEVKGPGAGSYDVYEPHFQPQEEEEIKSFFGNVFKGSDDKKKKDGK